MELVALVPWRRCCMRGTRLLRNDEARFDDSAASPEDVLLLADEDMAVACVSTLVARTAVDEVTAGRDTYGLRPAEWWRWPRVAAVDSCTRPS